MIPWGLEGNSGKEEGGVCLCSHMQASPGICRCVLGKRRVGGKRGSGENVRRHLGSFWFHLGPEGPRLKHVSRLFPDRTKPLLQMYWMVEPAVKWGPERTRRLCSTFPGSVQDTTVSTREKQNIYSKQHQWQSTFERSWTFMPVAPVTFPLVILWECGPHGVKCTFKVRENCPRKNTPIIACWKSTISS